MWELINDASPHSYLAGERDTLSMDYSIIACFVPAHFPSTCSTSRSLHLEWHFFVQTKHCSRVLCCGVCVYSASSCLGLSGMSRCSTTRMSIRGGRIYSAGWWLCLPFSACRFSHWVPFFSHPAVSERSVLAVASVLLCSIILTVSRFCVSSLTFPSVSISATKMAGACVKYVRRYSQLLVRK